MKMKISVQLEVVPKTGSPAELAQFLEMLSKFNASAEPEVTVQLATNEQPTPELTEKEPELESEVDAKETEIAQSELMSKFRSAKKKAGTETVEAIFKKHGWKHRPSTNDKSLWPVISKVLDELVEAAESAEQQEEKPVEPPAQPPNEVEAASDSNTTDWDF